MTSCLKVVLFGSLLAGLASLSSAQPVPADRPATRPAVDPIARIDALRKTIADELGLSDEQKDKIDQMIEQAKGEIQQVVADFQKDQAVQDERLAKIRQWGEGLRTRIEGTLTDEQKQKLASRMSALRGPAGAGAMMLDRIQQALDKLDLSDEQKAKVKDILADAREKFAKIREEARQNNDFRAVGEKLRTLMQDVREQIKNILTPEQQQKLQAAGGLGEGLPGAPGGRGGFRQGGQGQGGAAGGAGRAGARGGFGRGGQGQGGAAGGAGGRGGFGRGGFGGGQGQGGAAGGAGGRGGFGRRGFGGGQGGAQ